MYQLSKDISIFRQKMEDVERKHINEQLTDKASNSDICSSIEQSLDTIAEDNSDLVTEDNAIERMEAFTAYKSKRWALSLYRAKIRRKGVISGIQKHKEVTDKDLLRDHDLPIA